MSLKTFTEHMARVASWISDHPEALEPKKAIKATAAKAVKIAKKPRARKASGGNVRPVTRRQSRYPLPSVITEASR